MTEAQIQQIMAEQEQQRQNVLKGTTPEKAAVELAQMALKHNGSGSEAAAMLLLSMEFQRPFDFTLLLKLDPFNRAKADLMMTRYKAHDLWPSVWMEDAGYNGKEIMQKLNAKWGVK